MMQQYNTDRPEIRRAIEHLNNNYGWGDVTAIRRFMDGRIAVDVSSRYRQQRTYLARTVGRSSVVFRGHQINYTKLSRAHFEKLAVLP